VPIVYIVPTADLSFVVCSCGLTGAVYIHFLFPDSEGIVGPFVHLDSSTAQEDDEINLFEITNTRVNSEPERKREISRPTCTFNKIYTNQFKSIQVCCHRLLCLMEISTPKITDSFTFISRFQLHTPTAGVNRYRARPYTYYNAQLQTIFFCTSFYLFIYFVCSNGLRP
jgi:hypothetical protein